MEENLEPNNKATNEISDNATKSNSEEIKEPKSDVQDIKGNNSISQNNEEDMESNVEMPPQRDIRETQPTISVNYRVVKNMNDNIQKKRSKLFKSRY